MNKSFNKFVHFFLGNNQYVRECAEMVKTHEKTKIGVSLNVLIISEEEVNEIVETLVHSHKCTAKKEDPDNV